MSGLVTGRISMMWGKVWGTLDGISLAVFEDEDVSLFSWEQGLCFKSRLYVEINKVTNLMFSIAKN